MSDNSHTDPQRAPRRGLRYGLLAAVALALVLAVGWFFYPDLRSLSSRLTPDALAEFLDPFTQEEDAAAVEQLDESDVASDDLLVEADALEPAANAEGRALAARYVTPTPTPTFTPTPAILVAVAGSGGANLWREDDGSLVEYLPQGARLTATARTPNGEWIFVQARSGSQGWAAENELMLVRASALPARDVTISPVEPVADAVAFLPTPTPTGDAQMSEADDGETAVEQTQAEAPAPADDESRPSAQVADFSGRLNLRSGPGPDHAITAKALPDETYIVLGRDATGEWIQLRLTNVLGGFGWAAAEYLEIDTPISELPVLTEINQKASVYGAPTQPSGAGPKLPSVHAPAQQRKTATGLYGKLVLQEVAGGEIYLFNLVSGQLRKLTTGIDPSLSPDGRTVAFTRDGGEHGLYLIDVDGQNERKIFGERELFRAPKWSPDGSYIVFSRGDDTLLCRKQGDGRCFPESWFRGQRPGFDFGHLPLIEERKYKLARVDVNGENYRDIVALDSAVAPDWVEAGIVYQSKSGIQRTADKPDAETELVYFNILKQYELDPDWRPNGGQILFQQREASHWEIYTVNPDGSGLAALTRPATTLVPALPSNVSPAWSPDGKLIAFLSNRDPNNSAGKWGVWVMRADGAYQRRLPINLDFEYGFAAEQMVDWGR